MAVVVVAVVVAAVVVIAMAVVVVFVAVAVVVAAVVVAVVVVVVVVAVAAAALPKHGVAVDAPRRLLTGRRHPGAQANHRTGTAGSGGTAPLRVL